jgi:hypothetical protein
VSCLAVWTQGQQAAALVPLLLLLLLRFWQAKGWCPDRPSQYSVGRRHLHLLLQQQQH